MHVRWTIALLIVLCLMLAACGEEDIEEPRTGSGDGTPTAAASPTSEPSPTAGPSVNIGDLTTLDWQLVELEGTPVIDGSIVTMTFIPDNRSLVNGYTDCHGYSAGIEWDETSFALSESGPFAGLSQHERTCQHPEGGPEQDTAFFTALSETASYHASNERLVFSDANGDPRLTFTPRDAVTIDPILTDTVWALTSVDGESPLTGSAVTIAFGPEGASGTDGCNGYGVGLLFANDGRLTFAGGHKTEMACLIPEGVMEQADHFFEALLSAVAYRVEGDQLELMGHDGTPTLVFGPQAEVLLIGSSWTVPMLYTELPGGEIRGDALVEGTEITLTFGEDGIISGSSGCNTFSGGYGLDGASIAITTPLATTRMACPDPPGIMEQEMTFLDTLQAVTTWEIGMNGLTLKTDDGRSLRELQLVSPPQ